MYIFVSVLTSAYYSKVHLLLLTLTAAEYKVLGSASKTTPNNEVVLLLSFENPNVLSAFHIVKMYFLVGKIHQIRLAVLADCETCQFGRERSAIHFLTGPEVENVESLVDVEDHKLLPIWTYGTILSTEHIVPGEEWLNA